jgi:hypothetical protein
MNKAATSSYTGVQFGKGQIYACRSRDDIYLAVLRWTTS